MSVIHTKPYEITKFSDICNFIYSLNQSHSRSLTFLFTHSPPHNSHQSHNLSHSPNHSINDTIIRRCTQTHNHSVLHENVRRSAIHTRPYEIIKFSKICDSIFSFNQSHTHAYSHTHSFTHPKKITNQQPLTSPIKTATRSMSQILNHLLIHKSFCNALIHSLCTLQSTHLSGHHFGHQDDSPTVVGIPWNDSKLQRLLEWFYWTGGTDITIAILGRYGRSFQPFVTKMLQHGWLTIRLKISVRVWEIVPKSVCLTVLLKLYTGVHQRMAWIGQPWKLMAPVVTDVGQDWPTSATHGAAYLAHGHEFCENF